MKKKPKVLHVLSQLPGYTGSGQYVRAILKQSVNKSYRCFLLSAGSKDDKNDEEEVPAAEGRAIVNFGSQELPFPIPGMSDVMPYRHSRFKDLSDDQIDAYECAFGNALIDSAKRFEPDIIHCHHLWLLTSLTRRIFPDIPVVATSHGSDLRQMKNLPRYRDKVIAGCAKLDRVMSLSQSQSEEINELYGISPDRISVVGGGYRSDLFKPALKSPPPPVNLIYGGKISSEKGIPWLTQALKRINEPWRLTAAGRGTGEDGDRCFKMLHELGSRVELPGQISPESMAGLMAKAHIFVLPSLHEGLPLVLLEALASGCRVVATALPGIVETLGKLEASAIELVPMTLSPETVWTPDKKALSDMVVALERQINKVSDGDTVQIPQNTLKKYTWESVFDRIEIDYRKAMINRGTIL